MDGVAAAHKEDIYVVANRAPFRPHGHLGTPIFFYRYADAWYRWGICALQSSFQWRAEQLVELDAVIRQRNSVS